jgi:hypothetical protein
MPLNFVKFFDPIRLFHLRPAIAGSTVYFLLVVFGVMVLTSIVLKIARKKSIGDAFVKILLKKYDLLLLVTGISGIALTWIRYERVYILSGRFWLLVWFTWFIVWLMLILHYQFRVVPSKRQELIKSKEFHKYLPKKK